MDDGCGMTPTAERGPHDVLAAEAFAVPAPDPILHHGPLAVPEDLTGSSEPRTSWRRRSSRCRRHPRSTCIRTWRRPVGRPDVAAAAERRDRARPPRRPRRATPALVLTASAGARRRRRLRLQGGFTTTCSRGQSEGPAARLAPLEYAFRGAGADPSAPGAGALSARTGQADAGRLPARQADAGRRLPAATASRSERSAPDGGGIRSVIVPSASRRRTRRSRQRGWGWTLNPMSYASAPISSPSTVSAISSPAPTPTIPAAEHAACQARPGTS